MGQASRPDAEAETDPGSADTAPCAADCSPVATAGGLVLLSGLVLLTWSASMGGSFQFDDFGGIVNDPRVRGLWPPDSFISNNRPFGLYTFALNFAAGGFDPAGYHAVNLLIHLASAITLFFIVRSVLALPRFEQRGWTATTSHWTAWCCAAIWAVHPLTTQAVTYIVQRYESLAALFGLIVLLSMIQQAKGRRPWLIVAGIAAWLGMLSKEPMATIPFIALAFDFAILRETSRARPKPEADTADRGEQSARSWRWPFYAIVCSSWLWFIPSVSRWIIPRQTSSASMGFNMKMFSPWEYLRTQPEVLLHYLRLSFWPSDLCFDYTWRIQYSPGVYLPLGGLILLIAGTGIWWTCRRRPAGFFLLAPLLYLAPTSSFLPVVDPAFEHRMYLPLVAVVTGTICGVFLVIRRLSHRLSIPAATLAVPLVFLVIVPLAWRTHLRNLDYRSELSLWADTVKKRPLNPRAHFMLGQALLERGRVEEAQTSFLNALRIGIPIAAVHVGLGECYRQLGDPDAAIGEYEEAIKLKPGLAPAHNLLGATFHRSGRFDEARVAYQAAADLNLPEARYNLADVLIELGDDAAAVPVLLECLETHPEFERPARRLAWIHATSADDKLLDGERALKILADHCQVETSTSPFLWDTYAAALARVSRYDEAARAARRALELASEDGRRELQAEIKERLASYSGGRAWRQTGARQS